MIIPAAVIMNSCAKLDQVSPSSVPVDKLFKDTTSLNEALVGLYSTLEVREYYGGLFPMFADLNSDNGIAGGYQDNALDEFGLYQTTPANAYLENMYVAFYHTVASANAIIAGAGNIKGAPADVLNRAKGQALAIRAMAHFDALRSFGYHWDISSQYGIPIVNTVQKATDVVKRSTVADSYAAIIADLKQAETDLKNDDDRDPNYVNPAVVDALLARVYLYKKDFADAAAYASKVINDGAFEVMDKSSFPNIYTQKSTQESVFELPFSLQTPSFYNAITYARPTADITEVLFIASENLKDFLTGRKGDLRINLLDTDNGFEPNARTLKYSSDAAIKDNSAYVIRISELYLIRAEALGRSNGINDLNLIRANRGLAAIHPATDDDYAQAVDDERRAELNFEGHRFFDLARTGQVPAVLGVPVTEACFPIPDREINATHGAVIQNPGF